MMPKILKKVCSVKTEGVYRVLKLFGIKIRFINKKKLIKQYNEKLDKIESRLYCLSGSVSLLENHNVFIAVQTSDFLKLQKDIQGNFQAYDVCVRFGFAEEYLQHGLNEDNFWAKTYKKMQEERGFFNVHNFERFTKLIDSYRDEGFDPFSKISVSDDLLLDDGSHRCALACLFGVPYLSIIKSDCKMKTRNYGLDWFKSHNFSDEEIEKIVEIKNRIFQKVASND